jgi:peptide deformylase
MEITKIPDKILAKKVAEVPVEDIKKGSYKELVSDMKKAMNENNGVGLAANQIDKDLAVFVVDPKTANAFNAPEVYFNPEITEYSKDVDEIEEGCLSVPEYWTPIQRSKKIWVKFVDENGVKQKIKAKGFLARVIQHEVDHLNGKTIKDRARI